MTDEHELAEWLDRETTPLGLIDLYNAVKNFGDACDRVARAIARRNATDVMHTGMEAIGAWFCADVQWQVTNTHLDTIQRYTVTQRLCIRCRTLVHMLESACSEILDGFTSGQLTELCALLQERCDRLQRRIVGDKQIVSAALSRDKGPDDPSLS
jgi:hypothetical protein